MFWLRWRSACVQPKIKKLWVMSSKPYYGSPYHHLNAPSHIWGCANGAWWSEQTSNCLCPIIIKASFCYLKKIQNFWLAKFLNDFCAATESCLQHIQYLTLDFLINVKILLKRKEWKTETNQFQCGWMAQGSTERFGDVLHQSVGGKLVRGVGGCERVNWPWISYLEIWFLVLVLVLVGG